MKIFEIINIDSILGETMATDKLTQAVLDKRKEQFLDYVLAMLHRLVTSKGDQRSLGSYAFDIAKSVQGVSGKELERLYIEKYGVSENNNDTEITQAMLNKLESYLDQIFKNVGIDVEFTRHFLDRVNDSRNKQQITLKELALLFKDAYLKYGKKIAQMGPAAQAVIKDMRSDVNVPFVLNWDESNNELDLVAKTVMRKKNFHTPDIELPIS